MNDRQSRMIVPVPMLVLLTLTLLAPGAARAADRVLHDDVIGHAQMDDDRLLWMFRFDELEWQERDGDDGLRWDIDAWIGRDENRLWLRAEGARSGGETDENSIELLWWRPVSARWNVVAGLRQDFEPETSRTFAAIGLQGLAPQWIHLEATAYLGEGGRTAATVEADYDLRLTNRLILSPRVEAEAWGRDDPENGIGSGLGEVATGLRLRYEIRRKFAPYVGVEWRGRFGDTADLSRDAGEPVRDTQAVAGLRLWF